MVVTIGYFDGVHLGHRKVLRALLEKDPDATVITLWPHPRTVLHKSDDQLYLLSSSEEKMQLLHASGVKNVKVLEFTCDFASKTAAEFVDEILIRDLNCTCLVLGYDNRLGSDGLNTQQIAEICESRGLTVEVVAPYLVDGFAISSTRIRNSLLDGDMELVNRMLGYKYPLTGIVIPGNRIGRTLGFPTANIRPLFPLKAVPKNGVYATEIVVDGRRFKSMTNIGIRPTLGEGGTKLIETNIFDFDEDIYGKEITLNFIARIREEKKFPSLEALKEQLIIDKHRCYGVN